MKTFAIILSTFFLICFFNINDADAQNKKNKPNNKKSVNKEVTSPISSEFKSEPVPGAEVYDEEVFPAEAEKKQKSVNKPNKEAKKEEEKTKKNK
ncbi:MAG: hypothetical protein ABIJ97_15085 [Bacteroidota bacterium]